MPVHFATGRHPGFLNFDFTFFVQTFGKGRVKTSGMCCTITTGGQSVGKAARKDARASVPPVEAPTAISPCGRRDE